MSEHQPIDENVWTGRIDQDGEPSLNQRWHQAVKPYSSFKGSSGLAVIGFACDEGVKRNHGRIGASPGA